MYHFINNQKGKISFKAVIIGLVVILVVVSTGRLLNLGIFELGGVYNKINEIVELPVPKLGGGRVIVFAAEDTPLFKVDLGEAGLDTDRVMADSEIGIKVAAKIKSTDNFKLGLVDVDGGEYELKIEPKKKGMFRPGRYKIEAHFVTPEGVKDYSQDFMWGVLAMNFNKSVYLPGDRGYLQMGVLDDRGNTLCNAELKLEIRTPEAKVHNLSTLGGGIVSNPACGPNNVIETPDYYSYYQFKRVGIYQFELTAETENGSWTMLDYVEVKKKVDFEVERIGPSRIYPKADYEMKLRIKANKNFKGEIRESVPEGFKIKDKNEVRDMGERREIYWQVDFKKGKVYELSYTFDAPDVSPEFYLLGPLEIGEWQEARYWQIANDATLEFYKTSTLGNAINCTSSCPTSWTTVETLTVDRTSLSGNKDFLIMASMEMESTGANNDEHGARLTWDSGGGATSLTDAGDATNNRIEVTDLDGSAGVFGGMNFAVVATTTIAAGTSYDFDLDYHVDSGSTIDIYDVSIVAIELPSGTFAEDFWGTSYTNDGSTDTASMTFTPPSQQDYLVISYAEVGGEDWGDSAAPIHNFLISGTATSSLDHSIGQEFFNDTANDNDYYPMVAWDMVNLSGATIVKWNMTGGGGNDAAIQQNNRIYAIPLADFDATYYAANSSAVVTTEPGDCDTPGYDDILSYSPTLLAGDHIAMMQTNMYAQGAVRGMKARFEAGSATDDLTTSYKYEFGSAESMPAFQVYGKTYSAGSADFKIRGCNEVWHPTLSWSIYKNSRILVLDVPEVVVSNNTPSINSALDEPDPIGVGAGVNFTVNWSDSDAGDMVKVHICKTNEFTTTTPACTNGTWVSSSVFTNRNPDRVTYTTVEADKGNTRNYYAYVCDDEGACDGPYGGTTAVSEWWDTTWGNRLKLTIDNTTSTSALTNFPISVQINSSRINYSNTQDSGEDIRFINYDGTALDYEIENWNESGTSTVWVEVPSIEGSTTTQYMYMYYRNSGASDNATTTGVWDENYVLVQHLQEGYSTDANFYKDSTRQGNHGQLTDDDTDSASATGKIDGALDFEGDADFIDMGDPASSQISGALTLSAWVKEDGVESSKHTAVSKTNTYDTNMNYLFQKESDNKFWAYVGTAADNSYYIETDGTYTDGTMRYVVMVYDPSTALRIYVDGVLVKERTDSVPASIYNSSSANLKIGQSGTAAEYMDGIADEVRISNIDRTTDWIAANYESMTDDYITYAAAEMQTMTFTVANQRPDAPTGLLVEGMKVGNASNITNTSPEFSAVYKDSNDEGDYAEDYCVEVDTQFDFEGAQMWTTDGADCYTGSAMGANLAEGARSVNMAYGDTNLVAGTTYYWRMWFWDGGGGETRSITSTVGWFKMANNAAGAGVRLKGLLRLLGKVRLQ